MTLELALEASLHDDHVRKLGCQVHIGHLQASRFQRPGLAFICVIDNGAPEFVEDEYWLSPSRSSPTALTKVASVTLPTSTSLPTVNAAGSVCVFPPASV